VAISPSPYSEYLIRWTRRAAFDLKVPWTAIYIDKRKKLSESATKILLKNMTLARELGAEVIKPQRMTLSGTCSRGTRQKCHANCRRKPLKRYVSDFSEEEVSSNVF